MNWFKVSASIAASGRAFHALSVTGRKECLNTSLLQWDRMNGQVVVGFVNNAQKQAWRVSRVATKFDRQNSRQGCFKELFMIFKDVKMLRKCRVAASIREISARCITLRAKVKDFKDAFQNSRIFP